MLLLQDQRQRALFAAMLTLNLNYASLTTVPQSRTLRAAGCPRP